MKLAASIDSVLFLSAEDKTLISTYVEKHSKERMSFHTALDEKNCIHRMRSDRFPPRRRPEVENNHRSVWTRRNGENPIVHAHVCHCSAEQHSLFPTEGNVFLSVRNES